MRRATSEFRERIARGNLFEALYKGRQVELRFSAVGHRSQVMAHRSLERYARYLFVPKTDRFEPFLKVTTPPIPKARSRDIARLACSKLPVKAV